MKKATTYRDQLSILHTSVLSELRQTVAINKTLIVADNSISGMH